MVLSIIGDALYARVWQDSLKEVCACKKGKEEERKENDEQD
jgi:hypothetical protein